MMMTITTTGMGTGTESTSGRDGAARRLRGYLLAEVDGASLAVFRIAFGAVLFWEVVRYFAHDRVYRYYIEPHHFFSYISLLRPWAGSGMYWHFVLLGALSLLCAAGLFYRVAAPLLCAAFTYVFLLDRAQYLNHFYLICLLSLLLAVAPAHRAFSLDRLLAARRRGSGSGATLPGEMVPRWSVLALRVQIGIVYFYGGVAKLNPDWLRGEPMGMWLAQQADEPLVGPWLAWPGTALVLSYAGLLVDLSAPLLLSFRRTLPIGAALCVAFHLANAWLFRIGVFPWLMIATLVLFVEPGWPRRLLRRPGPSPGPASADGRARLALLYGYMLAQLVLPLRHWLYPGDVNWNEAGHRFSWRMKLRDKEVDELVFHMVDPRTGVRERVELEDWLTEPQIEEMATRPDMLVDFGHLVADRWEAAAGVRPIVTVKVSVSLNGGPYRDLIDPALDLAGEPRGALGAAW